MNSIKSTTEQQTFVDTYRTTPTQASSTQQLLSMITQGVIAAKSNSEIPVEPPDLPIPLKLLDPQDATTNSNDRATLEDTSKMPCYCNTTGTLLEAQQLEVTPTLFIQPQLPHYACCSQAKPKLAISCRSMPLDYVCTTQYSLAASFIRDPHQSLAFTTAKMKPTHSSAMT